MDRDSVKVGDRLVVNKKYGNEYDVLFGRPFIVENVSSSYGAEGYVELPNATWYGFWTRLGFGDRVYITIPYSELTLDSEEQDGI